MRRVETPAFGNLQVVGNGLMKATRKQKLRKKELKRRTGLDRKYAVVERLLDLLGVNSLFRPLDWMTREELVSLIKPGLDVKIADDCLHDPQMEEIKSLFELVISTPLRFSLDGRDVAVSLDDVYRGLYAMQALVKYLRRKCSRFQNRCAIGDSGPPRRGEGTGRSCPRKALQQGVRPVG